MITEGRIESAMETVEREMEELVAVVPGLFEKNQARITVERLMVAMVRERWWKW